MHFLGKAKDEETHESNDVLWRPRWKYMRIMLWTVRSAILLLQMEMHFTVYLVLEWELPCWISDLFLLKYKLIPVENLLWHTLLRFFLFSAFFFAFFTTLDAKTWLEMKDLTKRRFDQRQFWMAGLFKGGDLASRSNVLKFMQNFEFCKIENITRKFENKSNYSVNISRLPAI